MSQADDRTTTIPSRRALLARVSPIPTAPSRRGFFAVLGAGTASVIAPAALARIPAPVAEISTSDLPTSTAPPSPDAALLQLFDQYMAARSEFCRLLEGEDRMAQRHNAENPMPDVLRVRPGDADLGLPEILCSRLECSNGASDSLT